MSNMLGLDEEVATPPIEQDNSELEQRMKSGANWFYWISGLSLVNSLIFAAGSTVSFLGGLGLAIVMDVFASAIVDEGGPALIRAVAVVFNFILVAIFAFFGYYAGKGSKAAFIGGIILYFVDALLVLLLSDFLMAGFHAFALFFVVRGFLACREISNAVKPIPTA